MDRASECCPACGSPERSGCREVADHEYGVAFRARFACCAACGSEYQEPMPDPVQLASFYPEAYHSFQGEGRLQQLRHDLRARRLAGLLDALPDGDGPLLDYGCGDGSFLLRLAERLPGRPLFGFEIAERPACVELAEGRVRIVRGRPEDLLAVLPPCRLVTMNHVIEHLPAPGAVIEGLRGRLLPGGLIEGQTPATGCTEQRVFGERWSGYHAPRHTVVFSPEGLERLFARAGLELTVSAAFNPAGLALSIASLGHGAEGGVVPRQGLRWLLCLGLATALAPVDLWLGRPAVMDFVAR